MKVEHGHNPFEDSKEEFEGSTVNLKRDEERGSVSLSLKNLLLSLDSLKARSSDLP